MKEADFWSYLEHCICDEINGMTDKRLGGIWCDGLWANELCLDEKPGRIHGEAYMMGWKDWRFTLILDQDVDALDEINWEALLPVAGVTCWLSFDFAARRLEIEPGVAVPDLE